MPQKPSPYVDPVADAKAFLARIKGEPWAAPASTPAPAPPPPQSIWDRIRSRSKWEATKDIANTPIGNLAFNAPADLDIGEEFRRSVDPEHKSSLAGFGKGVLNVGQALISP